MEKLNKITHDQYAYLKTLTERKKELNYLVVYFAKIFFVFIIPLVPLLFNYLLIRSFNKIINQKQINYCLKNNLQLETWKKAVHTFKKYEEELLKITTFKLPIPPEKYIEDLPVLNLEIPASEIITNSHRKDIEILLNHIMNTKKIWYEKLCQFLEKPSYLIDCNCLGYAFFANFEFTEIPNYNYFVIDFSKLTIYPLTLHEFIKFANII